METLKSARPKYPLVLAEHDPAYIRYFPSWSKRRRQVIARIEATVGGSYKRRNTPFFQTVNLKRAVEGMSSVTMEMALNQFGGDDKPDMIHFFIAADKLSQRTLRGEVLVRAVLSYTSVLDKVIPYGAAKYLLTDPHSSGIDVVTTFHMAKLAHRKFYSYEDLSAMEGEVRAQFEAVLSIITSNMHRRDDYQNFSMSKSLVEVIINHHDRTQDILKYQSDRNLELTGISAKLLAEYLDAPAPSLSSGLL